MPLIFLVYSKLINSLIQNVLVIENQVAWSSLHVYRFCMLCILVFCCSAIDLSYLVKSACSVRSTGLNIYSKFLALSWRKKLLWRDFNFSKITNNIDKYTASRCILPDTIVKNRQLPASYSDYLLQGEIFSNHVFWSSYVEADEWMKIAVVPSKHLVYMYLTCLDLKKVELLTLTIVSLLFNAKYRKVGSDRKKFV